MSQEPRSPQGERAGGEGAKGLRPVQPKLRPRQVSPSEAKAGLRTAGGQLNEAPRQRRPQSHSGAMRAQGQAGHGRTGQAQQGGVRPQGQASPQRRVAQAGARSQAGQARPVGRAQGLRSNGTAQSRAGARSSSSQARREGQGMQQAPGARGAMPARTGRTTRPSDRVGTGKSIAIVALLLVVFVLLSIYLVYDYITAGFNSGDKQASYQTKQTLKATPTPLPQLLLESRDVRNILLIGNDARPEDDGYQRSDTMIILSIDQKRKKLKLTSIQRDMLAYINGDLHHLQRINASFNYGPEGTMQTINQNLSLNISDFIMIDMNGVAEVIDLMKGIEVDVPDSPAFIAAMNDAIDEQNKILHKTAYFMEEGGTQLLSGSQALAYMRVRSVDSDFERNRRQREVLGLLFKKFKAFDAVTQATIVKSALSYLQSNMSFLDLASLAKNNVDGIRGEVETMQVPAVGFFETDDNFNILPALNRIIPELHQFIFEKQLNTPAVPEIPGAPN